MIRKQIPWTAHFQSSTIVNGRMKERREWRTAANMTWQVVPGGKNVQDLERLDAPSNMHRCAPVTLLPTSLTKIGEID